MKEIDHHGKTSRHDKKDRKKEAEAGKEEEREKTEEIKVNLRMVNQTLIFVKLRRNYLRKRAPFRTIAPILKRKTICVKRERFYSRVA